MSKTKSPKAKSSARTKKPTSAKKSTPKKHPPKWGVFINANHVTKPMKVTWDDILECYCTEEDTFTEPHGFVFASCNDANLFVQGAKAARFHISRMIGMQDEVYEEEEYDEESIYEEELYESQK